MKIAVFGLSISSAWGNGHATLLRGLFRALHELRHEIDFFERDAAYYAAHRDVTSLPYVHLHLYSDWNDVAFGAKAVLAKADVAIVTSYCPDGRSACELILESRPDLCSVFYDMDTPVTLSRLEQGEAVDYLPAEGLKRFDLVLSYTGGKALEQLKSKLGARRADTLYGWVDPEIHSRVPASAEFISDLTYLGTYAADRQQSLIELFLDPAREFPDHQFVLAGAMYADTASWPQNVRYFSHIPPPQHSRFYSSSPLTLSITRATMASMGYCPSGRLFEAAACGTAVVSDWWEGLDEFFQPGREILVARSKSEAIAALTTDAGDLQEIGARARERTLDCHTATIRAQQLVKLLEAIPSKRATLLTSAGKA